MFQFPYFKNQKSIPMYITFTLSMFILFKKCGLLCGAKGHVYIKIIRSGQCGQCPEQYIYCIIYSVYTMYIYIANNVQIPRHGELRLECERFKICPKQFKL